MYPFVFLCVCVCEDCTIWLEGRGGRFRIISSISSNFLDMAWTSACSSLYSAYWSLNTALYWSFSSSEWMLGYFLWTGGQERAHFLGLLSTFTLKLKVSLSPSSRMLRMTKSVRTTKLLDRFQHLLFPEQNSDIRKPYQCRWWVTDFTKILPQNAYKSWCHFHDVYMQLQAANMFFM